MSVTISEALQQAQEAISSGNYRAAVSTCDQLVQQFPSFASAHRLLGEAWLEQGQNSEAERSFSAALAGNPRHPWAYLGLGLIAEDRGANDPALAFTQVAWELAPNIAQLREPVRRTAMRRYGADGQLQFTRAALAQLHANNARNQRAAVEFRAALGELPGRLDLQLGYAEVLWRLGQDAEAANICRALLEDHPDAVQALVILAEIEHRGGDARRADAWLTRVRAVDPDGAVTSGMLAANPRADRDWLVLPDDAMPVVVEGAVAARPDMPHIAPAPDFEYVPSRPEAHASNLADLRPMGLEEFGAAPAVAAAAAAGFLLQDFEEQPFDPGDLTGHDSRDADAVMGESVVGLGAAAVVAFDDHAEPQAPSASESAVADQPWQEDDELGSLAAALEGDVANALSRADIATPDAALLSEDPADNLPPDVAPAGYTTMLRELGDEGLAPFDALDQSMPAPELPDDLLAAEVAALAGAPDSPQPPTGESINELDALAGDWDAIDDEIQSAVPGDVPSGYTQELRSLEGSGLEPFDVDAGAEAAPDGAAALLPEAAAAGELDELWLAESPAELATADVEPPLESLLAEAPMAPEAERDQAEPFDAARTVLGMPVAGAALAAAALGAVAAHDAEPESVEIEPSATDAVADADVDLVAVVEPAIAPAEPELAALAALAAAEATSVEDTLFADLEPFAAEDFDQGQDFQTKQFSFGPAPWDTAGQEGAGRSVVPSDADLEIMLAAEDAARARAREAVTTEVSPPPMPEPVFEHTPEPDPVSVEAASFNTDELPTANLPADWQSPSPAWPEQDELQEMFGSSLAVTRALGANEEPPAMPEAAAPAQEFIPETPSAPDAPGASSELAAADESYTDSIDDIRTDAGVFERARAGKSELIEVGAIAGNLELEDPQPVAEAQPEMAMEPEREPEPEPIAAEAARVTGTGAFRDVDTLRAALAADPDDPELHWWLAQALHVRGDVADAIGEYRWLVRNAPDQMDAVITALNSCVDRQTEVELAHRLLADIYRRRGDSARASRHAAMSLQSHRRARG